MKTLTQAELQGFLAKAAIVAAGPELRIGREVSYHPRARRTVVIQFARKDSAGYVSGVVSILLSSEESWLLVARYGSASQLGDLTAWADAEGMVFASSDP
jgi:hypothetical protein